VSASLSAIDGLKENRGREVIISLSTSCLIRLLPSKVIDLIMETLQLLLLKYYLVVLFLLT